MTSIIYAHYNKTVEPGSFQRTIDEMYGINGVPSVVFPTNVERSGITEIYKDTVANGKDKKQQQPSKQQKQHKHTTEIGSETQEIYEYSADCVMTMDANTEHDRRNRMS